jgi:hypothetical protein
MCIDRNKHRKDCSKILLEIMSRLLATDH